MRKLLTLSLIIFFQILLYGQNDTLYYNLIDTATRHSGLFVSAFPVKSINLNLSDTSYYRESLKEESNYDIARTVLLDLIGQCKKMDTSQWKDIELKNVVLVKSSEDYVSPKAAINKFKWTNKVEIANIRREIRKYNDTNPPNRDIYYFSRPIYDSTKTFAVVSYGNGNKGKMGRDYISLFHFDGTTWTKIGVITRWIY